MFRGDGDGETWLMELTFGSLVFSNVKADIAGTGQDWGGSFSLVLMVYLGRTQRPEDQGSVYSRCVYLTVCGVSPLSQSLVERWFLAFVSKS